MSNKAIDKYGHCVKCHKFMIVEEVIEGKVQTRFSPQYDESYYLLDDGSQMKVAICKKCKSTVTKFDNDYIMNCVIAGWLLEVKAMKKWDDFKKRDHMAKYSKKRIVCRADNVPDDLLRKELKKFKAKKDKIGGAKFH